MNQLTHSAVTQNNTFPVPVYPSYSNGKEKDRESGFHYYGARYYWGEVLTGWLSVDPMADKYPGISPYAYCAWNPVRLVDPVGMDTLLFSHNGYYETTLPGGDNIGIIRGEDGSYSKTFAFADNSWCQQFVKKNDAELEEENTSRRITGESVLYNRIYLVSDNDIQMALKKSGVNIVRHFPIQLKLAYVLGESRHGTKGRLDFVNSINKSAKYGKQGQLFITTVNGVSLAHDQFNLGNFLWGAAMKRLDIDYRIVVVGSNLDNYIHHHGEWDSLDDQTSISHGYSYVY